MEVSKLRLAGGVHGPGAERLARCMICPRGWTRMLMFWSKQPELEFFKVRPRDWLRDSTLCPEHTVALDGLLIPLAREVDQEPQGNA